MRIDIDMLLRKNIRSLNPYSSARDEYSGTEGVFLDANENPWGQSLNRYPDPLQRKVKQRIMQLKGVATENMFLGNGSDEAIDLIFRAFCNPGTDNVVAIDPTYGMYQVCADINQVDYRKVLLDPDFQPNVDGLLGKVDNHTKLLFLCSPNNPTANSFETDKIAALLQGFSGLVVLDEAYIDFSASPGYLGQLKEFKNLVILQTFSKAWGLAGIRLGMCFADEKVIAALNKIKYPYNINVLTIKAVLEVLDKPELMKERVKQILIGREHLVSELGKRPFVLHIYTSDANFLLVKVKQPLAVYRYLVDKKIIVRDRSNVALCEGCLRITVGTPDENAQLLEALNLWNG